MAEQEIGIRVRVDADEAVRRLREVAQTEQQVAGATRTAGEEAEQTSRKGAGMNATYAAMASQMKTLVAGMLGTNGVIAVYRMLNEEMERNARLTREAADAQLDLQYLSQTFDPQEREFVNRAAVAAGRQLPETLRAYAGLKSFFPGLDDQTLQSLFLQIAETAVTTTAPLETLTGAFQGLFDVTRDPQQAQNILRQTIVQGGRSDPGVISKLLGKFLGPGINVGGLSPAQAAGAVAGVTGLTTQQPEEQVQGLLTFMLQVMGDSPPEVKRLLAKAGVDTSQGFFPAIEGITSAVNRGALSKAQFQTIVSREGIKVASALLDPTKRAEFFAKINRVVEAGASDRDLTADAIANQFRADPTAARNYAIKQAEAREQIMRAQDADALEIELGAKLLENTLYEQGMNVVGRKSALGLYRSLTAFGMAPENAASISTGGGLKHLDAEEYFNPAPSPDISGPLGTVRGGGVIYQDNRVQYGVPAAPEVSDSGRTDQ